MKRLATMVSMAAVLSVGGLRFAAAATPAEIEQLRGRIAELQQVRRELDAAREAHRQQVAEVQRQIEQLREDRERVQPLVEGQRREVERLTAQRDAAASQAKQIEGRLSAIAEAAKPAAAVMLEQVQGGIPFDRDDRASAVASFQGQLGSEDLLSRAGGVEALAAFAGEELQLMRTSEVWNAPLVIDDGKRRIEGYHGRLGLVSLYFLGEDGETVGMTHRGQWLIDLNSEQRQSIVRIIRMLQGQAPPAIVDVPLAPPPAEMGNRGDI